MKVLLQMIRGFLFIRLCPPEWRAVVLAAVAARLKSQGSEPEHYEVLLRRSDDWRKLSKDLAVITITIVDKDGDEYGVTL